METVFVPAHGKAPSVVQYFENISFHKRARDPFRWTRLPLFYCLRLNLRLCLRQYGEDYGWTQKVGHFNTDQQGWHNHFACAKLRLTTSWMLLTRQETWRSQDSVSMRPGDVERTLTACVPVFCK